jgi:tetratricopeptide (TPR) repeat protein
MRREEMMLARIIGSLNLAGMVFIGLAITPGLPGFFQISNSPATLRSVPEPGASGVHGDLPETSQDQKTEPHSKYDRVKDWRAAARQHNAGNPDSAAKVIGGWPKSDIEFVLDFVSKLASQPAKSIKRTLAKAQIRRLLDLNDQEVKQGDLSRIIRLGVLLHTDIALLNLDTGEYQRSPGSMGVFVDGNVVITQPKTLHWEYARKLVDSIISLGPNDQIARQWYIATTAYMQSRRLLGYAGQNLRSGLEKYPSDYSILFYAGALHENWASPANQYDRLLSGLKFTYGSRESELMLAQNYFEKSIAANPDFAEARMRFGRVLSLLGLHGESIEELQQAAASLKDPQLLYYASLFLGCEFEILPSKDKARDQYENAAKLYPTAQSPLLALSRLSGGSGDAKGALDAVQRVFALAVKDFRNDDPWWAYDLAHVRNADALMAEIHKTLGVFPQ